MIGTVNTPGEGGGGSITVDPALSTISENPAQNKVITAAINELRSVTLYLTEPTQANTLTYNGSSQSPTWNGYDSAKMTMGGTTSGTNAGDYTATFTPKSPYMWSDGTRAAKNVTWTIGKATGTLTLSNTSLNTVQGTQYTVTATKNSNAAISASSDYPTRASVSVSDTIITITGGTSEGSATITVTVPENTNYTGVSKTISVTNTVAHVYGVQWDGTSSTTWTRTDEAASFTDPVPYVSGASSYSSPFDNKAPWSGMTVSERTGGKMVAIPKFWYKITQSGSGMKIQIADKAKDGFSVSPAHTDRGDGKGERNTVYIGKYHCRTSDYKSFGGSKPKATITRSAARTAIHNLGANIWQADFAMRFTLWLLYIVEFANWNSQDKIGYGCGNGSSTENMGYTDSMPYHTGTTLSSRTAKGIGTQYRNIEGLWDNVYDWCDGCYNNSNGLNIILNPNNFSDSSGGTAVGIPTSGWPSAFDVKNVSGTFPMFIPSASSGSETTFSCDYWSFSTSDPCVYVGGVYDQSGSRGMFYVNYSSVSRSVASIGTRLMELP